MILESTRYVSLGRQVNVIFFEKAFNLVYTLAFIYSLHYQFYSIKQESYILTNMFLR